LHWASNSVLSDYICVESQINLQLCGKTSLKFAFIIRRFNT